MYSVADVATIINAKHIQTRGAENSQLTHLLTDSRLLSHADHCLFFALVSAQNDGHFYIKDLYTRGVRNFVVDNPNFIDYSLKNTNYLLVANTRNALQQIAAYHRRQFSIPVVGITGSNGKTVLKEWLFQLLCEDKQIVRNPKSYNSQIGVPLSVWQMQTDDELAIFEAGISQPDEMDALQRIIQPTIGIFTNIGSAHDSNFADTQQKVGEKLKLFKNVQLLIYRADYADIHNAVQNNIGNINVFTWSSTGVPCDMQITRIEKANNSTTITACLRHEQKEIHIPFIDDASIENAIHAWCFLLYLGYDDASINAKMQKLTAIEMRLDCKAGINNCSIINDTYNSDIKSLQIALDFIAHQKGFSKKTVILSDLLQSRTNEEKLYTEIASLLVQKNISRLIGIGESISKYKALFPQDSLFFRSTQDFLQQIDPQIFNKEVILIKGARAFQFERISGLLQKKSHQTVLEVNLSALVHNYKYYKQKLKPQTKMTAMVKANAYGLGSYEVANALQFSGIDYLAVAYTDEAIELRNAGITVPIIILNSEYCEIEEMLKYNLQPAVYNFNVLAYYANAMRNASETLSVHLKIDTGMHRFGFMEHEIEALVAQLKANPQIHIASVFSHFATADMEEEEAFVHQQANALQRIATKIKANFSYKIWVHILNTAGISRYAQYQFDMARLGIGLYGIATNAKDQLQLENVACLKTRISQIKHLKTGETVSYGRRYKTTKDTTIGILPIGYADGLNRKLSNGNGVVYVNNHIVPIVGTICMDICMIDITDIPAAENDEVEIFGPHIPIADVATRLDTIPYEIIACISPRVNRIYFSE